MLKNFIKKNFYTIIQKGKLGINHFKLSRNIIKLTAIGASALFIGSIIS